VPARRSDRNNRIDDALHEPRNQTEGALGTPSIDLPGRIRVEGLDDRAGPGIRGVALRPPHQSVQLVQLRGPAPERQLVPALPRGLGQLSRIGGAHLVASVPGRLTPVNQIYVTNGTRLRSRPWRPPPSASSERATSPSSP